MGKLFGNRRPQYIVTIAVSQDRLNVRTLAGSPTVPGDVTVNILSGVVVYSSLTGTPALRIGVGWPADCAFRINNSGTIAGDGGDGGAGGAHDASGSPGSAAGNALDLDGSAVSIDNTSGYIYGGGGGGGGGAGGKGGLIGYGGGGGGGQAGQFSQGGAAGGGGAFAGGNGSLSGPGNWGAPSSIWGGYGGQGGVAGQPGPSGDGAGGGAGGAGGAAGKAVHRNGGLTVWLGGNNATQVKGADS